METTRPARLLKKDVETLAVDPGIKEAMSLIGSGSCATY